MVIVIVTVAGAAATALMIVHEHNINKVQHFQRWCGEDSQLC